MDEIWDLIESVSEGFPTNLEIWDLFESVSEGFPTYSCSFLYGKKEILAKGKGNVYNHLLGNVLNNHILYAQAVIQCV